MGDGWRSIGGLSAARCGAARDGAFIPRRRRYVTGRVRFRSGSKFSTEKTARTKIVNQCLTLLPHPRRVTPRPFAASAVLRSRPPLSPVPAPSIARRRASTHTAKGLPIIIRGTLRTVLLFIGSAIYYSSFIILRCPLQRAVTTRQREYAGAGVVSHSVTALRRRYEWHRGRERACVLRLPVLSRARPRCARVGTPRVRSSKYKVNTSPPWERLLCTRTLFYRRYITR